MMPAGLFIFLFGICFDKINIIAVSKLNCQEWDLNPRPSACKTDVITNYTILTISATSRARTYYLSVNSRTLCQMSYGSSELRNRINFPALAEPYGTERNCTSLDLNISQSLKVLLYLLLICLCEESNLFACALGLESSPLPVGVHRLI